MDHTLQDVTDYLLRINHAVTEEDSYLKAWMSPALSMYFLEHAVEVIPTTIRFGIGIPFQCHMNALTYAGDKPGTTPYFGFQLLHMLDGWHWFLHSFVVDVDGSILDSGLEASTDTDDGSMAVRYFAVEWGWELFDVMQKKGDG